MTDDDDATGCAMAEDDMLEGADTDVVEADGAEAGDAVLGGALLDGVALDGAEIERVLLEGWMVALADTFDAPPPRAGALLTQYNRACRSCGSCANSPEYVSCKSRAKSILRLRAWCRTLLAVRTTESVAREKRPASDKGAAASKESTIERCTCITSKSLYPNPSCSEVAVTSSLFTENR